jgi:hypothetical protein
VNSVGHSQYGPEPELGAEDERDVKSSRATLGRHITSEPGFAVRDRRHKHVRKAKKLGEKVFHNK